MEPASSAGPGRRYPEAPGRPKFPHPAGPERVPTSAALVCGGPGKADSENLPACRGFTLIEVLVSIAIMGMIATLVWSSQSATFAAGRRLSKIQDVQRMGGLTIAKLEADLSAAYIFATPVHLGGGDRGEQWVKTEFVGEDQGDKDAIRFVSFSHQRLFQEAHESDQAEVAYRIGNAEVDDEKVEVLERRESKRVDTDAERGGRWLAMAERVTAFNLEYWDLQKKEWVSEWKSTGVDTANRLPGAVRVILSLADPFDAQKSHTFKGVAMIPMAPGPNDF